MNRKDTDDKKVINLDPLIVSDKPLHIEYDELAQLLEETKSDRFEVEMDEISLIENLISLAE